MAGCIEDLFTQYLWDFDRLKGLTARLWKSASRVSLMGTPLCCYYNIWVLRAQHTNANAGATIGSILAVLRKRFGARSRLQEVSPEGTERS